MSVVVTRRYSDKIEIGSDSQTTIGDHKLSDNRPAKAHTKVYRVNGIVVGHAGRVRDASYLHIFARTHKPRAATSDAILEWVVEFVDWCQEKQKDFKLDSQLIVIYKGKGFQMLENYLIEEIGEYAAIGSGMFLAIGALYYGKSPKEAIRVAKEFDLYCGGKTKIITIKHDRQKEKKRR